VIYSLFCLLCKLMRQIPALFKARLKRSSYRWIRSISSFPSGWVSVHQEVYDFLLTRTLPGYALLYESMLDSVLRARDRFLRPGGLVAPSEARIKLALIEGSAIKRAQVGFWDDVYGMSFRITTNWG
jgi:hypothetical protein